MRTSETTSALFAALADATLLLSNPSKANTAKIPTKSGGTFSYRFADLPAILDEVRPVLQAHGLVVAQEAAGVAGGVGIATMILHRSGEWIAFDPLVLPAGDAREIGSSVTYGRRYTLCAVLGIAADEDDDGAKAASAASHESAAEPSAPPAVSAGARAAEHGTTAHSVAEGNPSDSAPAEQPHEGGAGSDPLADLLEATGGSEVKAVNAINKATSGTYRKADLESLSPDQYAAGLAVVSLGGQP